MGAEFVRGRVCQGPSLLGAEMSRNPYDYRYLKYLMFIFTNINEHIKRISQK